jgi:hypothetical protein
MSEIRMKNVYSNLGGYCKLKKISKTTWIFLEEILLMIMLCYMHSLSAGHYANYYPINGTFQNYNPVRRLLSGQIPYKDFQDYLGLGHLYTGSVFTVLFGGTYRASLVAFSFLTFGGLALLSLVIGMAIFRRKEIAAAVTNIVLAMLLIQPLFFTNTVAGTREILDALNYALGTGNSARFVRGMILPIFILLIWGAYRSYLKIGARQAWVLNHKDLCVYAGIGLLGGFAFTWSNDYGISCWVCLIIMTFWLSLSRTHKFLVSLRNTGIELAGSILGIVITIFILTVGHLSAWFSSTFGTGGYQSWYYNSTKSYYLYDVVDFSYIMLIQAGISVAYLIKLFIDRGSRKSLRRYGIPGFANMVCFCAVNEYQMLSGGGSREVALAVLFLTIVFEICSLMDEPGNAEKCCKEKTITIVASCILALSLIISSAKDEFVFSYMSDKDGTYVETMGGNLTSLANDLLDTNKFLNGNRFFATYASAQEVVSDTFQPSGTDYIIHVLGDQQREDYLDAFTSGDFKYAATIKETYTDWEYWVQRSNWFFYRELYSGWHPVYANTYEVYWKRKTEGQQNIISDNIGFSIVDVDLTCKKLIVQTDASVNGIADVYIDYVVNKNDNRSASIVFQRALKVENTGTVYAGQGSYYESNYLRAKSLEYIPVPVVNGYGEATLTAGPERSTYLQLNAAECNQIFTCTSDYLEISDVTNDEGQTRIYVANTAKNMNSLLSANVIKVQGNEVRILKISDDDSSICIAVDDQIDYSKNNGNYLEVIERK